MAVQRSTHTIDARRMWKVRDGVVLAAGSGADETMETGSFDFDLDHIGVGRWMGQVGQFDVVGGLAPLLDLSCVHIWR